MTQSPAAPTPAAEAREWLNDGMPDLIPDEAFVVIKTIREALDLLDQVQCGDAKVLVREPAKEIFSKLSLKHTGDLLARIFYHGIWDAAPPKPEGEMR